MKLKHYLKAIFPGSTTTLCLFILPLALSMYMFIIEYSDYSVKSGINSGINIDQNVLTKALFGLPWANWLSQFGDFAFWGIIALVVLVSGWLINSARVTYSNHFSEVEFINFKGSKRSWNSHFLVAALIKIILAVIFLYLLAVLLAQTIPHLGVNIRQAIESSNAGPVLSVLKSFMLIVLVQFFMIACLKTYRAIEAD